MKRYLMYALRARAPVRPLARTLALLLVVCGLASGQSIVKQTPASTGSTMKWERGSLTMTIGQPAAGRIVNGSVEVHAGFLPPTRSTNVTTGIPSETGLRIHPQPARDVFRLELPSLPSLSMGLYDVSGRLCLFERYVEGGVIVDLTSVPTGLYFLRVYSGSEILQTKLITVIR